MRIGRPYIEDINFSGAPTADRERAKWKKYHITKVRERKARLGEDSDEDFDPD